jgi:multidrug efflux system membrane fusion protein
MTQNNRHELPTFSYQRGFSLLSGLLIVLALAAGAYFYYQHSSNPPKDSKLGADKSKAKSKIGGDKSDIPSAVSIETSSKTDFPVYLTGLGTVTALRTVTVRPRVEGELVRVAFTEGQMVKEGDLLAEIDPRPFQIQLQQTEGQLLRDQALLKNSQLDYDRYQTLLKQDSISAQQTVTQESQVRQYQGTVEMDKAQVNNAKLQLSYARVTAPISGRVGLRQVDQGNIVRTNDTNGLVVITQVQPITVVFTLPEDKVQSVVQRWARNEVVTVEAYDRAGKNKLADGKLLAIDNQIDSTTGTLKLKAQFDNKDNSLFANQFVNIKMHLDTLTDVTQVNSAAIQHDTQGAFVYLIKPDKTVQIRRVTVGETQVDKVVVTEGLAPDETVVIEGGDRLHEGDKVDVAEKDGQPVAANPEDRSKPPEGKEGKFSGKRERRL